MAYWPATVMECIEILTGQLSFKDRVAIANMSPDEIADLNLGNGSFIQETFGLLSGNDELLQDCAQEADRQYLSPEEASVVILARLGLELQKTHKLRKV